MRRKILFLGWIFLIVFMVKEAVGTDFSYRLSPLMPDGSAWTAAANWERGSTLMCLQAQMRSMAGGQVTGFKANLGSSPAGFDNSLFSDPILTSQVGGTWNSAYSTTNLSSGNVQFIRAASSGGGLNVTSSWAPMYQIDFPLVDGASDTASTVNFNQIALTENAVFTDFNGAINQLSSQASPYSFNVIAAAPPQGWTVTGNLGSSSTDNTRGNTIKLAWNALPNTIGTNPGDLTPPIKYDLYRGINNSFAPSDDPTTGNRVIKDITPSTSFTYAGGSTSITDGPDTGVPGSAPNNLSDCTPYYYTMRAKDSTTGSDSTSSPQHKTTNTGTDIVGPFVPHDYTPPAAPAFDTSKAPNGIREGNGSNTLYWTNPGAGDLDFDKVIILRKEGTAPTLTLKSAFDKNTDENGDPPPAVGTKMSDGSVLIYNNNGTEFTDTGADLLPEKKLTNGVKYFYSIYAYDKAEDGPPRQQGFNYSAPASSAKAPGVAPDNVANIRALADPNTGDITLKWTNPIVVDSNDLTKGIDANKAKGYGGSLAVYTSDFAKWNQITPNSAVVDEDNFGERDIPILDLTDPSKTPAETIYTLSGLSTIETYYFKVFSYNIVPGNDRAVRKYQSGVNVAALPLKGGAGTGLASGPISIPIGTKNGLGINTFSIPFDTITVGPKTARGFVEAVNSQAKANVVTVFGYWDNENKKFVGGKVSYDQDNKPLNAGGYDLSKIELQKEINYQVSVFGIEEGKPVSIKIEGERQFLPKIEKPEE